MTEKRESSIAYLDKRDIETIHLLLASKVEEDGDEFLPPFSLADQDAIDALVDIPRRKTFGKEQYPTLESKAAIIFYTINKRQIFLNGNKRMSTLCLLLFLVINQKFLDVSADELTKKALWLANTSARNFQDTKDELEAWIKKNMIELPAMYRAKNPKT